MIRPVTSSPLRSCWIRPHYSDRPRCFPTMNRTGMTGMTSSRHSGQNGDGMPGMPPQPPLSYVPLLVLCIWSSAHLPVVCLSYDACNSSTTHKSVKRGAVSGVSIVLRLHACSRSADDRCAVRAAIYPCPASPASNPTGVRPCRCHERQVEPMNRGAFFDP